MPPIFRPDQTLFTRTLPAGAKFKRTDVGVSLRRGVDGMWCSQRLGGDLYRRCVDGTVVCAKSSYVVSDEKEVRDLHDQSRQLCCWFLKSGESFTTQ